MGRPVVTDLPDMIGEYRLARNLEVHYQTTDNPLMWEQACRVDDLARAIADYVDSLDEAGDA